MNDKQAKRVSDLTLERKAWSDALRPLYDHYERMWEQWYVRELEQSDQDTKTNPFLSNERVHLPFQVVETMVPRVVGSEPKIAYRAMDSNDDEPIAHMMGGLATWQTKKMRLEQELRDFVRQGEVCGYTVAKHGWDRVEEIVTGQVTAPEWDEMLGAARNVTHDVQARVATRNQGFFETVNVLDFVYPLNARRLASCSAVWQRRWCTLGEVKRMGELGLYQNVDQVIGGDEGQFRSTRLRMFSSQGLDPAVGTFTTDDERSTVIVWERWANDSLVAMTDQQRGGGVLLRDEGNTFDHNEKPYLDFSPIPHPFQLHGIGLVQLVFDTTASLNTLRRQRRDSVTYVLNPAWKTRGGLNRNRIKLRPGFCIDLGDMEDIEPLTMPNVNFAASLNEEQRMREDAQEATGAFTYLQGAPDAAGSTATEVATVTSEGNKRIAEQIKQLNERTMVPLARQLASNILQWIDVPTAVRFSDMPDEAQAAWQKLARLNQQGGEIDEPQGLVTIDPQWLELAGELEPVPDVGQDAELNKVQRVSNAVQWSNMLAPIVALPGQQIVDLAALARWEAKQFDIPKRDIDQIVPAAGATSNPAPPPPPSPSGPSGDNTPTSGVPGQPAVAGAS